MSEVLTPRPASTILPLRDGPHGVEVLVVRRNLNSDFVGGAYVFPGGAVDPDDEDFSGLCHGRDDAGASQRLGLTRGGLAYYVAALRELFEEAGLLVARRVDAAEALADEAALARWRVELNGRRCRFADVLEDSGLVLDLAGVEYLAHWVTPVGLARRYDTRFFVVQAPSGQIAEHDAAETVAHRWIRPVDALAAASRGDITMILPTLRNLDLIVPFDRVVDVLAWARSRDSITRVEPRIVERRGRSEILAPGDAGYESAGPA